MAMKHFSGWRLNGRRIINELYKHAFILENNMVIVDKLPYSYTPLAKYETIETDFGEMDLLDRTFISFIHGDHYYYVQLGGNPFMDCIYIKVKLLPENGNHFIPQNVCGSELLLGEWFDKNEYAFLTDDEISAVAKKLIAWLINAQLTHTASSDGAPLVKLRISPNFNP